MTKKIMTRDQIIRLRTADPDQVQVLVQTTEATPEDLEAFTKYKSAQELINFGEFHALRRLYWAKKIKAEEILKCIWPYRIMQKDWVDFCNAVRTLKANNLDYIDN